MSTNLSDWLKLKSGSDIRGDAGQLTDEFAEKIGFVFAQWVARHYGTTSDKLSLIHIWSRSSTAGASSWASARLGSRTARRYQSRFSRKNVRLLLNRIAMKNSMVSSLYP